MMFRSNREGEDKGDMSGNKEEVTCEEKHECWDGTYDQDTRGRALGKTKPLWP